MGALDTATDSVPVNITPTVGNGNAVFTSSTISSKGAMIYLSTIFVIFKTMRSIQSAVWDSYPLVIVFFILLVCKKFVLNRK